MGYLFTIRGVINKFVDKCYNLKIIYDKTKCATCTFTGLFCNLDVKLNAILTSGSAINEIWPGLQKRGTPATSALRK